MEIKRIIVRKSPKIMEAIKVTYDFMARLPAIIEGQKVWDNGLGRVFIGDLGNNYGFWEDYIVINRDKKLEFVNKENFRRLYEEIKENVKHEKIKRINHIKNVLEDELEKMYSYNEGSFTTKEIDRFEETINIKASLLFLENTVNEVTNE